MSEIMKDSAIKLFGKTINLNFPADDTSTSQHSISTKVYDFSIRHILIVNLVYLNIKKFSILTGRIKLNDKIKWAGVDRESLQR